MHNSEKIRVVQVDQRMELSDSQLEEIADQAHIHPKAFLGMISFINKYLEGKTKTSKDK